MELKDLVLSGSPIVYVALIPAYVVMIAMGSYINKRISSDKKVTKYLAQLAALALTMALTVELLGIIFKHYA